MNKNSYILNPILCKNCGKALSWEKRRNSFCDQSCSASFNNKLLSSKKVNFCLNCKSEVIGNNKYCNNICQNEYEYKTYINNWKLGEKDGMSGLDGISSYIKKYLFEKYNNSCQICGWNILNIYTNKIPLTIHHIDGNCKNNDENNLELLCPNCHSLTETYGGANKGKSTREYRYSKK
jgi:hypothetical protein